MTEGWKCPVCGRGVAPSEKVCEHGAGHGGWRAIDAADPLGPAIVPWFKVTPYRANWSGQQPNDDGIVISHGHFF